MSKAAWQMLSMGAGIVMIACLTMTSGRGQQKPAEAPAAKVQLGTADTVGCRLCHKASNEGQGSLFAETYKSNLYVRMNESIVWEQDDPHRRAYEVILPEKNPIAKQMQSVLAAASADPAKYSIAKDVRCLTCHSTDLNPGSKAPRLDSEFTKDDKVGVACAGCHGVDPRWQAAHWTGQKAPEGAYLEFRTKLPAAKAEAFGLRNLRDPVGKATLCASCHVGSPAEGKVVTHEMYAAGHPPLPPFEMVTFMEAQPRHWGYPMELSFLTDFAKVNAKLGWETFRFWHKDSKEELAAEYMARHLAVGAITALKAEMTTITADCKGPSGNGGMVDFARFDCYACHHDLQYPSDRQKRGYDGAPGRPTLKAWVGGLPSLVAEHAATLSDADLAKLAGEFPAKWSAVRAAAIDRPFGNPAKLAAAADDLSQWCDAFTKATEKGPLYTKASATDLMNRIADAAKNEKRAADAETAMHLLWAYKALRQTVSNDGSKVDVLKDKIPVSPRDLSGFKRVDTKMPVSVGDILTERQKVFNAFSASKFVDAFKTIADKK